MSSYAITGASKGIGLEYARQIAANPANTVLAIVRNPQAPAIAELASKHPNIHAVKGDVTDPQSIQEAAKAASAITGGKLDVFIHNSNAVDNESLSFTPTQFPFDAEKTQAMFDPPLRTAVYGGLWATNAFLPLLENGTQKKIIHISSGMGDMDVIKIASVAPSVPYSAAKAAMNIVVAKYHAELAPKGFKILALSPGWVNTWEGEKPQEMVQVEAGLLQLFRNLDPELKGQIQPEESVRMQLEVIDRLDAEMSGSFLSHHGNKNWL